MSSDSNISNDAMPQFKDQTFNYAAFCEILQPCNDSRITMTPAYTRLQEELDNFNPDQSGDSPYAIQPLRCVGKSALLLYHMVMKSCVCVHTISNSGHLSCISAQGEARAAYLKRKLQHKIISTRVSARELLGDYGVCVCECVCLCSCMHDSVHLSSRSSV
jgi:hypothetical protein